MRAFFSRLLGSTPAPARTATPRKPRVGLECLESRVVPATFLQNGDIVITGTSGSNTVQVSLVGTSYRVLDNGTTTFFTAAQVNGGDVYFSGYAGNDSFANYTALRTTAYGHEGNDELRGGSGNDYLDAGPGNDAIFGGAGNDILEGYSGNDTSYGGDGDDTLYGSSGHDVLSGEAGNDAVYGESGSDWLNGGAGNDYLHGGTENDTVIGGADGDTLEGYSGDDYLNGGTGNDYLLGSSGNDTIYGDSGNDSLFGESGADFLSAGDGNDYLDGGVGADFDSLRGGVGYDTFVYDHYTSGRLWWTKHHNRDAAKDFTKQDQIDYPNLKAAVARAFAGYETRVSVAGHGAVLKPIVVQPTADGSKVEGYFRHNIVGKDDKVYFSVTMKNGQLPVAEITHIEYNGLGTGKFGVGLKWAIKIAGYVGSKIPGSVGTAIVSGAGEASAKLPQILSAIGKVQRWLIGDWEKMAVAVVDAIAVRLAQ